VFVVAGAAAGSINFETTPWGTMGKREPQSVLKNGECNIHLELGREGQSPRQKPDLLEDDKLEPICA
jgi:hypothetical protein